MEKVIEEESREGKEKEKRKKKHEKTFRGQGGNSKIWNTLAVPINFSVFFFKKENKF